MARHRRTRRFCNCGPDAHDRRAGGLGPDAGLTESAAVATAQPGVEAAQGSRWERRNEVRCTDGKITGSHFQRRICLTEAQWDKLEEDGKQALRDLQGPKTGAR